MCGGDTVIGSMLWSVLTVLLAVSPGTALTPSGSEPAMTVRAVQRLALEHAGLEPARAMNHLRRMRWVGALPELRFRVVHDIDRDGRTTVRLADARWLGDVAAVDTRGEGLRLQGELVWRPGGLLGDRAELAALQELRKASAARRELLEVVTRAWFALANAHLQYAEARAVGDGEASRQAALHVAEQTAILDGLTGGRFSEGGAR